jgi:hypothetical protein
MVFDYAEHDLTGMIDSYKGKLTIPQVRWGGGSGGSSAVPSPS